MVRIRAQNTGEDEASNENRSITSRCDETREHTLASGEGKSFEADKTGCTQKSESG